MVDAAVADNIAIQVTLSTVGSGKFPGLVVRAADANNFLLFHKSECFKVVAGAVTSLGTYTGAAVFVTGVFGFVAAAEVVRGILETGHEETLP